MEHLSITFPHDLRQMLDKQAKLERLGRSTLIQKAVKVYLELKKRKDLEELLKSGYQEMSGHLKEVMKDFEGIDSDSLKYVD